MPRDQLILCGHLDGFCVRFEGVVIGVFPDPESAVVGMRAARAALTQLAATLGRKDA